MRHNTTELDIGITLVIDIARKPIVNDAFIALVDVVLAAIVYRHFEWVLVARCVSWAVAGKVEFIAFGIVVVERVRVCVAYVNVLVSFYGCHSGLRLERNLRPRVSPAILRLMPR